MSKIVEDKKMPEAQNDTNIKKEEEENEDYVTFVSQEGDKFKIKKNVAQMSELVKTMISPNDDDDDVSDDQEIPLINVKNTILAKVIEYMKWHTENGEAVEIEKPLKSPNMSEIVCEWEMVYRI